MFAPAAHETLRRATADLAWLLGRGYAQPSALDLVGNRYQLRHRQRMAVMRSCCSDAQQSARRAREVEPEALRGAALAVDGYNVLIGLESALSGGVLLIGRDDCLRDLASLHGHFKRVEETAPAIDLLCAALVGWGVAHCSVYLDAPVSNSGRLAGMLREVFAARDLAWSVEVVPSPDALLQETRAIVATADSAVLDACGPWFNLARRIVALHVPGAAPVDLATAEGSEA